MFHIISHDEILSRTAKAALAGTIVATAATAGAALANGTADSAKRANEPTEAPQLYDLGRTLSDRVREELDPMLIPQDQLLSPIAPKISVRELHTPMGGHAGHSSSEGNRSVGRQRADNDPLPPGPNQAPASGLLAKLRAPGEEEAGEVDQVKPSDDTGGLKAPTAPQGGKLVPGGVRAPQDPQPEEVAPDSSRDAQAESAGPKPQEREVEVPRLSSLNKLHTVAPEKSNLQNTASTSGSSESMLPPTKDLLEAEESDEQSSLSTVLADRLGRIRFLARQEPEQVLELAASTFRRWQEPEQSEAIFREVLETTEQIADDDSLESKITLIRWFLKKVDRPELERRVRWRVGRLYYEHGEFGKAAAELDVDKTLKDPDRYHALAGLVKGVSLIRIGKQTEALAVLRWVAENSPLLRQRVRAALLVGQLERVYNRPKQARRWLEFVRDQAADRERRQTAQELLAEMNNLKQALE